MRKRKIHPPVDRVALSTKILLVVDLVILLFLLAMVLQADAEYVTAPEGLNVREEPGTEAEILELLPFGSEVFGEIEAGWMRLEGRDGYVCADHLSVDDPFEDMTYMGTWMTTAYTHSGYCCANGSYPQAGYTVACNSLPFGTVIYIKDIGFRTVEDRGPSNMPDGWADIFMDERAECVGYGVQNHDVYLVPEEKEMPRRLADLTGQVR